MLPAEMARPFDTASKSVANHLTTICFVAFLSFVSGLFVAVEHFHFGLGHFINVSYFPHHTHGVKTCVWSFDFLDMLFSIIAWSGDCGDLRRLAIGGFCYSTLLPFLAGEVLGLILDYLIIVSIDVSRSQAGMGIYTAYYRPIIRFLGRITYRVGQLKRGLET
ncbi:hypothetical protein BJX64DRAFT_81906 [Aspergillus heterothallicus]